MQFIGGRPRLEHRGSVGSRAHAFVVKTLALVAGGVVLASAFLLSLVLFAMACAVIVVFGGYLWWKTRELRKQMRAQMSQSYARGTHDPVSTRSVIEGVVISRGETPGDKRDPR